MNTPATNPSLIRWTIWSSLLGSLLVYLAIPFVWSAPVRELSAGSPATLLSLFGLVGAGTGVLTFVIKRLLVTKPIHSGAIEPTSEKGSTQLQAGYLVTWVLSEAVGIYGLVLFFLSHRVGFMLPFVTASVLLLLAHAPRAKDLERPLTLEDLAAGKGTIG